MTKEPAIALSGGPFDGNVQVIPFGTVGVMSFITSPAPTLTYADYEETFDANAAGQSIWAFVGLRVV
jgi:hypothetical protein